MSTVLMYSTAQYRAYVQHSTVPCLCTAQHSTVLMYSTAHMALCHSQVTLMLSTDINITETTYSCQFQYEFGNQ